MSVKIFTDGACIGNPGTGGYAFIIKYPKFEQVHSAQVTGITTNQRMELQAALIALELLKYPSVVEIYSDSQYLVMGMSSWIYTWKRKNWLKKQKPMKNVDLWQSLDKASRRHKDVKWFWIKGHNGHPENERCNDMAENAARGIIFNNKMNKTQFEHEQVKKERSIESEGWKKIQLLRQQDLKKLQNIS